MKKLLSYLFLLVSVVCLAACTAVVSVDSLQVSGQKTEFVLGEEFSTGEMTVIAVFTNGNEEDVTAKAKVTPSTDMTVAGNFVVEVYYEGCTAKYNIRIEQPQLVSLDVNHASVKKAYLVGEELSIQGLEVVAHYTNSITGATEEAVEDYEVVVKNSAGAVVEGALAYVGEYTVEVSFGGLTESYAVAVSNDYASVADALAAGVANASKVASGTYTTTQYSENYETGEYEPSVESFEYAFGEKYFTYIGEYGYVYHYAELEDGSILGVQDSGYSIYSTDVYGDEMKGARFSILYYSFEYYGVEELVSGLYALAVEAGIEIVESVEAGVYSFAYNFVIESWSTYYATVEVSFTLGDGAEIATASYSETIYYSDEVEVAEDGSWVVVEGVEKYPTVYNFEQVTGEKVAENPYAPEKVLYSSFDFVSGEEVYAEGTYNIESGDSNRIVLSIANALPETAIASLNNVEVVVTNENGVETYDFSAYYSSYSGELSMYGQAAGTYTVTVTCGSIVKTYVYNVTLGVPSYMDINVYGPGYWGNEFSYATSASGYNGSAIYLKPVFPSYTDDAYTVELKEAYEGVELANVEESYNEPYDACVSFKAASAGEYVVVFTSVANPELVVEFPVSIQEAPEVSSILAGKYEYSNYGGSYAVAFTPDTEAEGISGTVAISVENYRGTSSAVYSYEYVDGEIVMAFVSGDETYATLSLNSSFNLVINHNGYSYVLQAWSVFNAIANVSYSAVIAGMECSIVFYSSGEGCFYSRGSSWFTATAVENADGSFTITCDFGGVEVFKDNKVVLSADFSSVSAVVLAGEEVEVVFEKPLYTLVADKYWYSPVWYSNLQFNSYGSGYGYSGSGYSNPDFDYSISKNEDGTYSITFDFESYGYESFIDGNVATLSADGSTITFTSEGNVHELIAQ